MKKYFLLLALIITFCGQLIVCAAPNYQVYQAKPYTQNEIVQKSQYEVIEIILDYSGSMRNWINAAKSAMQNILPQIPQDTRVGLRVFGQKQNNSTDVNSNNLFININHVLGSAMRAVGSNTCSATQQVVPISKINIPLLTSEVNAVEIGSATPLTLALERTVYNDFASIPLTQKKKIILITDGEESCGKNPCAFVRNLVRTRTDIQIDVIMINGGNKLQCLTNATNGKFYQVDSYQNFGAAFSEALDSKQNYTNNRYTNTNRSQSHSVTPHYQFITE